MRTGGGERRGSGRAGQVSVEYTLILATMLLILVLLIAIFNGIWTQNALKAQNLQARFSLGLLKAAADDAWRQGPGARVGADVFIPPSTLLENSSVANRTLRLYLAGSGDATAKTEAPISGHWPNRTGTARMEAYHNGTLILIRPAGRLHVNTTGLFISKSPSGSKTAQVAIRNRTDQNYTLGHSMSCPSSITCSHNGSAATLQPGAAYVVEVEVSGGGAGTLVSGYYAVNGTADPAHGLPNETYVVPIQVDVS